MTIHGLPFTPWSMPARRHGSLAVVAALAVLLALPAGARAEIIDYDPSAEVPALLTPDELERLAAATEAGIVFMTSELSPEGAYVQAFVDGVGFGFLDLATGDLVPVESTPGQPVTEARWVDPATLAEIRAEYAQASQDEPPTVSFFEARMDAATGAVVTATIDAAAIGGEPRSAGPGLGDLLVLVFPGGTFGSRRVDIAPTLRGPRDVPDGLPGAVGSPFQRTLEVQQASFSLVLVAPDGSRRRELASLPPETAVADVTWSADGTRMAILTRTMPDWQSARDRGDDPVIPGTPNLGSINVREGLGLVAPADNPLVAGTQLHIYDVATGRAVRVLAGADFPEGMLTGVAFAPSGGSAVLGIATRSELRDRPQPIYSNPSGMSYRLLDPDGQVVRPLAIPGADSLGSAVEWIDPSRLVAVVPDETDSRVLAIDVATGASSDLWREPGAVFQTLGGPARRVFTHGSVTSPWEVWEVTGTDPESGRWEADPVTTFHTGAAESAMGIRTEPVQWRTRDGETLHGLFVHAAADRFPPAQPGPVVVWQMGGPGGQMTSSYGATVEEPTSFLPHFGLPVLVVNAAGRTVQSPSFYSALADGRNFGQIDIAQVRDGVEALVDRGIVDPRRVGVTGCSYGGYFTLQSMRTYPDLYAAGNAQCSLVDLTEEFTFGFAPFIAYLEGRSPTADPDEYVKDSPLYGVRDIKKPVLLFHGTEDFLPDTLIASIHDELVERGVPARMLRISGEGHGFGSPSSQEYAAQEQILFFRKHLIEDVVGPPPPRQRTIYLPSATRGEVP